MPTNRRCHRCCPSGTLHVANASNTLRHLSTSTTSMSSVNSNTSCFQWPDFLSREVFGSLREQIGRHTHFNLGRRPSRANRRQHLLDQSPNPCTANNTRFFESKQSFDYNFSPKVEHFLLTPASSNFEQSIEVRFENNDLLQTQSPKFNMQNSGDIKSESNLNSDSMIPTTSGRSYRCDSLLTQASIECLEQFRIGFCKKVGF